MKLKGSMTKRRKEITITMHNKTRQCSPKRIKIIITIKETIREGGVEEEAEAEAEGVVEVEAEGGTTTTIIIKIIIIKIIIKQIKIIIISKIIINKIIRVRRKHVSIAMRWGIFRTTVQNQ